ncbi:trimeric intracellular cation channel family protein [Gymnodinialimonas sp.]
MTIALSLDYASALIFALTGALAASRAQLDIVGFIFFAALTAIGGGTLRDLLLDRDPVFWIADATPLAIAMGAAILVFFTAHLVESRLKWLIWLDAAALAIAVAAGVSVAKSLGASAGVIIVMGVATGTFGGLLRDVVANEVPLVLKQGELYVTAAVAGAGAALLASAPLARTLLAADPIWATVACVIVTFGLRAGSLLFGWRLPVYKSTPPRQ